MNSPIKPSPPEPPISAGQAEGEASTSSREWVASHPDDAGMARLFQQTTVAGGRDNCPTSDDLFALSQGEATAQAKIDLVNHLTGCSDCSLELQALKRSNLEEPASSQRAELAEVTPLEGANADSVRHQSPNWARWLTAAAVLFVAGSLATLFVVGGSEPEAVRSATEAAAGTLPFPDAVLTEAPTAFAWEGNETEKHSLRLMTAEGDVLFETDVLGTTVDLADLDEGVGVRLSRGGRFLWTVVSAGGGRIGPHWFEVRNEPVD